MAARGSVWELTLARRHKRYAFEGSAFVEQHYPKAKYYNGRWFFEKKGAPDFGGTLKGGRSVVFDAKETQKKAFYLSDVPEHQLRSLQRHHALGAVTFLCVWFKSLNQQVVFFAPFGTTTLRPEDGLPISEGHWLEVVDGAQRSGEREASAG